MDMPTRVSKMRLMFHANMLSVNNVLNQLGIISDEKAECRNCNHIITIVNDILPRIYGEEAVKELLRKNVWIIVNCIARKKKDEG